MALTSIVASYGEPFHLMLPPIQHEFLVNQVTQREEVISFLDFVFPVHIQLVIFSQAETQIPASHRFQYISDRGVKNDLYFQVIGSPRY